jgi:thioredoxin 1
MWKKVENVQHGYLGLSFVIASSPEIHKYRDSYPPYMPEGDAGEAIEVDSSTWEKVVEKATLPVSVMFYSPVCPHCRVIRPYFEQYAREMSGKMVFAIINVSANAWIGERYGIRATPTFKWFCNGKPVQELVGAVYPALLKKISEDVLVYGRECAEKSTALRYEISGYG